MCTLLRGANEGLTGARMTGLSAPVEPPEKVFRKERQRQVVEQAYVANTTKGLFHIKKGTDTSDVAKCIRLVRALTVECLSRKSQELRDVADNTLTTH